MNFLSKLGLIFLNLDNLKNAIVQVYVILNKIKPALELVNNLVPDDTKIQKGLDKIFPVFNKVIDKTLEFVKIIASFVKIELPVVNASSADPFGELEKLVK
jgi:hypothetical protein